MLHGKLIDLHCHLDGSITLPIAKKLMEIQNIDLGFKSDEELKKKLTVPESCESLLDFLACFPTPLKLLQTKEGIRESVHLVQENLKSQGLVYAELRFAPQLHCDKGLTQEEVIQAALEGLKLSELHSNLILCLMRLDNNKKENMETIELAKKYLVKDNGVVALDIAGPEKEHPLPLYKEEFGLAKKYGIPFTLHAGEADGSNSVKAAIEIGACRIGHGVNSIKDEELVKEIIQKQICLEMCITSNRQTKSFNMKEYPIKKLLDMGVNVTINTDDMAISDITLSHEIEIAQKEFGLSDSEIIQCLKNSAKSAFTSEEYKKELLNLFN